MFVNETLRPILQQRKLPSDKTMHSARSFVDPNPEIVQLTKFEQTDPEIGGNLHSAARRITQSFCTC